MCIRDRLKVPREAGKQRRNFGVLKDVKLGDDMVALFSRFHPIHKAFQPMAPQSKVVNALGKHSGKKQGVIPDVLTHLPLPIKRRRGSEHGIGFHQHLTHITQSAPRPIADLEQLFNIAEPVSYTHLPRRIPVRRRTLHGAYRHVRVHGEARRRPPHRRASRLRRRCV